MENKHTCNFSSQDKIDCTKEGIHEIFTGHEQTPVNYLCEEHYEFIVRRNTVPIKEKK